MKKFTFIFSLIFLMILSRELFANIDCSEVSEIFADNSFFTNNPKAELPLEDMGEILKVLSNNFSLSRDPANAGSDIINNSIFTKGSSEETISGAL